MVTSRDRNVSVASHLSNLPAMETDAFTENLIELCAGEISKTGTSHWGLRLSRSGEQNKRKETQDS